MKETLEAMMDRIASEKCHLVAEQIADLADRIAHTRTGVAGDVALHEFADQLREAFSLPALKRAGRTQ